jgi:hypothetical protein
MNNAPLLLLNGSRACTALFPRNVLLCLFGGTSVGSAGGVAAMKAG